MIWFKKRRIKSQIRANKEIVFLCGEIVEILNKKKKLTDKGILIDFNFDNTIKEQLLILEYYKKGLLHIFGTMTRYGDEGPSKVEVGDELLKIISNQELNGKDINLILKYLSGFKHGIDEIIKSYQNELDTL